MKDGNNINDMCDLLSLYQDISEYQTEPTLLYREIDSHHFFSILDYHYSLCPHQKFEREEYTLFDNLLHHMITIPLRFLQQYW